MKKLIGTILVIMLIGTGAWALVLEKYKEDETMPVAFTKEINQIKYTLPPVSQEAFKTEELLLSQENLEFEATEGDVVISSAELLATKLEDAPYEGLKTALDIVNEGLGMAGVKAHVSLDNKDIEMLGKVLASFAQEMVNPDTGKMSWDLYVKSQAGKLAKVIQDRISSGTIQVKDGKISGADLAGAIVGAFYFSNNPNVTIPNN